MTTFIKNPDGSYTSNSGASSTAMLNSPQDSYGIFSKNLMTLLGNAQKVGDPTALLKSKEQLTNQSLNLSNPLNSTPYSPLYSIMNPGQSVQAQAGTQGAFQPALSSVTDQLNAANQGLGTFTDAVKTAYDVNKPIELNQGSSLISPTGDVLKQGAKYTPTFNYQKGIMDGFDGNTGTWASDAGASGGGNDFTSANSTPVVGPGLIAGVDFSGKSTGVGAYATDPNYENAVGSIYAGLRQSVPNADSTSLDAYIKGHAKSAPVSGQMILNAANQYGVDPLILTAVLAHESDFGTAGAATSTMNPGNVGNTGTSTRNYNSWQAGVTAAANELKRRMPTAGQTPPSTGGQNTTTPVGGQLSSSASSRVSQLPQWMQSYVDAGPKGVAYINDDRVPALQKAAIQNFAAKAGVPYLQAADASAIKSIGVVYQSMESMKNLANTVLSSGWTGKLEDSILGPAAKFVGTDWGNNLLRFDAYRDTAIKAVQALAGGAGSGLRINGAEIMANVNALPTSGDSAESANTKLAEITKIIDQQLGATFPYVAPTPGGDVNALRNKYGY